MAKKETNIIFQLKVKLLIRETQMRQYEGPQQSPMDLGQDDGQGVYFGLSTAYVLFSLLNYISCLCNYNAVVSIP